MWFRFPSPVILAVSGKDAPRYLNARLTNDSRILTPTRSMVAAALTAQGRVEGFFRVYCLDALSYVLVCDGGDGASVERAFRRFIVADRVTVERSEDRWCFFHVSGVPEDTVSAMVSTHGGISAQAHRIQSVGYDLLIPVVRQSDFEAALTSLEPAVPEVSAPQYHFQRACRGLPSYPEELNETVMLSECGMREAISFSKGCYVGQEVIERSDAVGRVPRKLERVIIQSSEPVLAEAEVRNADNQEIGKLVSSYRSEPHAPTIAFVLFRNGRYSVGQRVSIGTAEGAIVPKGEIKV